MSEYPDWPTGRFSVIYADPPWQFKSWSQKGKGEGPDRSPDKHYKVMQLQDIMDLPVPDIAAEDSCLFLWATMPMLQHALKTMEAWGYTYKTVAFTWAKTTKYGKWHCGLGYWTRANAELCLLGTRGHPKRISKGVRSLVVSQVREHSRKPDEVHQRIMDLTNGPYCELFGRRQIDGWTVWGNEVSKFNEEHTLVY